MVTTVEQLEQLKQELMNVKEFAVDLEVTSHVYVMDDVIKINKTYMYMYIIL